MQPTYTCCLRYLLSEFRLRCTHARPAKAAGFNVSELLPSLTQSLSYSTPKGFPFQGKLARSD